MTIEAQCCIFTTLKLIRQITLLKQLTLISNCLSSVYPLILYVPKVKFNLNNQMSMSNSKDLYARYDLVYYHILLNPFMNPHILLNP